MRKVLVMLAIPFWMGTWAQGSSVQEFQQNFSYGLRVAEMPCPEELAPVFPEATCYRHGYDNFFDFKEAAGPYLVAPGGDLEPWHIVTMNFMGERAEVFRTRYRPGKSSGQITLNYVSEVLLGLEASDVRASS